MLIDWFTTGAQALNFLILVWLMWRFLYKPVLNAIDAREKRIARKLADAKAKKAEAQQERDEFAHKNAAFAEERAALLRQAGDEAKAERQRLLEDARQAADSLSTKRQETFQNDLVKLNQAITRRIQEEVLAITRKALADLAGASLEERMCEVLARHLRALSGKEKSDFATALSSATNTALIRSTLALPSRQQDSLHQVLQETFPVDIALRFEVAPDLICGIELVASGRKLAWSIAGYLGSLENQLGELVQNQGASGQASAGGNPAPQAGLNAQAESGPQAKAGAKATGEPGAKTG